MILLSLDGAWRSGHSAEQIIQCMNYKLSKNENRTWPDWRDTPEDTAIEHIEPDGVVRGMSDRYVESGASGDGIDTCRLIEEDEGRSLSTR